MKYFEINSIYAGYDSEVDVLRGLSINLSKDECIALIGANGAGKSTLLKVISGIIKPKKGEIYYKDNVINRLLPHQIVDLGIIHVPEEGGSFGNLTIEENLFISCRRNKAKENKKNNLQTVYDIFPDLFKKRKDYAVHLSGGQRKMLSIGKALMAAPEFLLLDDISMGLAPKIVDEIYLKLKTITSNLSVPVIIVEQIVEIALDFAQRAYLISQGEVALHGASKELMKNDAVKKLYIGM